MGVPSLPDVPPASDTATRRAMQGNRRTGTLPELTLRTALHRRGLRFRKDFKITGDGFAVRADVVFPRRRLAVFVDGCYWHGCPEHFRMPSRNADYWAAKIARNEARDRRVTDSLAGAGWLVLRVWEHEPVEQAADRVAEAVTSALSAG
jgi:DNA mismatch endonuclease (patch repair protein)